MGLTLYFFYLASDRRSQQCNRVAKVWVTSGDDSVKFVEGVISASIFFVCYYLSAWEAIVGGRRQHSLLESKKNYKKIYRF